MATPTDYLTIIPKMEFIQGDTVVIPFSFVDKNDGTIIPSSATWRLGDYSDSTANVLEVLSTNATSRGSIASIDGDSGKVYVTLSSTETENIPEGKYTQQLAIIYSGIQYIRCYGEVTVRKRVEQG